MGKTPTSNMADVTFHDSAPSFLDRMNGDNNKRLEGKYVNEMKKQHEASGSRRKFRAPRDQNKKPLDQNEQAKLEPKVVTHQHWKIKEKTRYDGQWGPLGW